MSGRGFSGILSAPPYPRAKGALVDATTFNQAMAQIERSFAADAMIDDAELPVGDVAGTFLANGVLGIIPANAMIIAATLRETAGHNVSVSLGTSAGGAEILAATPVAASTIVPVSAFLLQAWTAPQTIYVASAAWGGAVIVATVWYLK